MVSVRQPTRCRNTVASMYQERPIAAIVVAALFPIGYRRVMNTRPEYRLLPVLVFSLCLGCNNPGAAPSVSSAPADAMETEQPPAQVQATQESTTDETETGQSDADQNIGVKPQGQDTDRWLEQLCEPGTIGKTLGAALDGLVATGDKRFGWVMLDRLRLENGFPSGKPLVKAFNELMGSNIANDRSCWKLASNLMIAKDIPAPDDYPRWKWKSLQSIEPQWQPFFADHDANIDWRFVSWGGVHIDSRPVAETDKPCYRCIPALTDPPTTSAKKGKWYADDKIVFGVAINGQARAYPKNVMEVHEMVNDELGGRRFAMPYCTLCGAAQLYFTDKIPASVSGKVELPLGRYELRTSGMLKRSNKVMFELQTMSLFDTFTGDAVSGPLRESGVSLEAGTVITTTWGDWKKTHPKTTILASTTPWGITYRDDPLGGRDDNGPIFPIGESDKRLPIQEPVLAIITPGGQPIAFPVAEATQILEEGGSVELKGVEINQSPTGLHAADADGKPIPSHQAFWFAWSQFHPDTELWRSERSDPAPIGG